MVFQKWEISDSQPKAAAPAKWVTKWSWADSDLSSCELVSLVYVGSCYS